MSQTTSKWWQKKSKHWYKYFENCMTLSICLEQEYKLVTEGLQIKMEGMISLLVLASSLAVVTPQDPQICPEQKCEEYPIMCNLTDIMTGVLKLQLEVEQMKLAAGAQRTIAPGTLPKDCNELDPAIHKSGRYVIGLSDGSRKTVYCDMETDGGRWLVFQRRKDGSEDFNRNWSNYENGFGNVAGEFWLGNKAIALITEQEKYMLRIDMEHRDGRKVFVTYSTFSINRTQAYRLSLGKHRGNASNSFSYHNGMKFSTFDYDNALGNWAVKNCAESYKGGWWFKDCLESNLNGYYFTQNYWGIVWKSGRKNNEFMRFTEMKIRPALY